MGHDIRNSTVDPIQENIYEQEDDNRAAPKTKRLAGEIINIRAPTLNTI